MTTPILADENVDHRIVHRLENYGYDVQHVDFAPELRKGTDDEIIATHSLETGRLLLTSDDGFLVEFGSEEYAGLLFIDDESLDPSTVAAIVHEILSAVDQPANHVFYVSPNGL